MQLYHKTFGHGEAILILHGLFGSLDNWHSISLRLAERFRVLAIDQRNHGHSPHGQEMNYRLMAEDLDQLLQDERIEQAHIIGHSMGGKTAMQFALSYPERVKKLVVVDIAPRVYPPLHDKVLEALMRLEPAQFQARKEMEEALAPTIPSLALRQFLLKNVERDSKGQFRWRFGLQEIYRNYPNLRVEISPDKRFENPVLFVRGASSDYLLEGDLPAIRQLFPQAQLKTIPDSGHLVHVENPAVFLATLKNFLTKPLSST